MKPTMRIAQLLHVSSEHARLFCLEVQAYLNPVPPFDHVARALEERPDLATDPKARAAHIPSLAPSIHYSDRPRNVPKQASFSAHHHSRFMMRTTVQTIIPLPAKTRPKRDAKQQAGYMRPAGRPKPEKNVVFHHGSENRHKHSRDELPVCPHDVTMGTMCRLCHPGKYSPLDN